MSDIDEFLIYLKNRANSCRENAAMTGSWDDGGYSKIIEQIDIFNAGRTGTIPPSWIDLKLQFDRERDPEYELYLKLKNKFEK